jgi:hypothetical protein
LLCSGGDDALIGHVVGCECLGNRDGYCTAVMHALDGAARGCGIQAVADIEEVGNRAKRSTFAQLDSWLDRSLAGLAKVGCATHSDHPDGGDITFEQRVDGLGRGVRDQFDIFRTDGSRELGYHVDDASGDTVCVLVRRGNDGLTDDVS